PKTVPLSVVAGSARSANWKPLLPPRDTPSQQLFSKAPRAFSSGCVRVEAVDTLLAWLLTPDELSSVQTRIASGETQQYRLQHPAPLLIAYWTVEASKDGALRYYPDIYARDVRLVKALAPNVH
ncbi:MAG: hypothetical protein ACLGID_17535, partial [Gammaproteobacteria bacterium]